MKKALLLLMVASLIFTTPFQALGEESQTAVQLQIYVDGTAYLFSGALINELPYLQIQDIAKAFSVSEKQLQISFDKKTNLTLIATNGKYQKISAKIPADSTVELDGNPVTIDSIDINKVGYFNLYDLAKALNVAYELDQDSGTYHVWTYRAFTDSSNGELDRAITAGIVPLGLQDNYDQAITNQEDAELISQMLSIYSNKDQTVLEAWKKESKVFSKSNETMHRSEGMMQIFLASLTIGLNDMTTDWTVLNNIIGDSCWDYFVINDAIYRRCSDEVSMLNGDVWTVDAASYFFSFGRTSLISGNLLFDYDKTSNTMRPQDPLTRLEAIEAALRLYESGSPEGEVERVIGQQEQDILTAAEQKKQEIINSVSEIAVSGTLYYVSNEGNDDNDGLSPATAWKTLEKVNGGSGNVKGAKILKAGDVVLFRRGDIFRGQLIAKKGVTYSTFGEGPKPVISLSPENGTGSQKWSLKDGSDNIWAFYKDITDCGALILNESTIAQKTCAYWNGETYQKIGTDGSLTNLDLQTLDNGWFFNDIDYEDEFSTDKTGKLYLRCDEGNPGEVYTSIEFFACSKSSWNAGFATVYDDSTVDNLCFRYGAQGIGAHDANGATIQNCEIGWMGGMVLGFSFEGLGGDAAAAIVRSGDGIMAGGRNIKVTNNYVHHTWDHGFTSKPMPKAESPAIPAQTRRHGIGQMLFLTAIFRIIVMVVSRL